MIKFMLSRILGASLLLLFILPSGFSQTKYQAPKAATAPIIDGISNDACWSTAIWYDVNYLWALTQPSAEDFSGKFKVAWDENKLYVLAEITDDVLNDYHEDPLTNYWEDDTWEIFLDENNSGGDHEQNYNAFAYHISRYFDIADIGQGGTARLLNDHATVARTVSGTKYTWEAAFDIYTDEFVYGASSNPKATLFAGKIMGFAMAYCDNDGGSTRQHFMGSENIPGEDKNVAWKDASVFGSLELVETVAPTFMHVSIASDIEAPTAMAFTPDGRILVCEQSGNLRLIKNETLLSTPALTLNVNQDAQGTYSERGLLGIAVDPAFDSNNYIYLFYTTSEGGAHNRVSRFTLNGDIILSGSEEILIELSPLSSAINHNGGGLNFGLDGKLYIATGDNYNGANAQNLEVTHGKLLRINSDGTVPADNPYSAEAGIKKFIWSYGLRNPFTFDVQPVTGKIFVNDVGSESGISPSVPFEEINDASLPGENFGWPNVEGYTDNAAYTNPVYAYKWSRNASDTMGCGITGGCFFNPTATNYPSKYQGKYFYMDFCNPWINVMDPSTGKWVETFARNVAGTPMGIKTGPDGNLYYISRGTGGIYKVIYSGNLIPDILSHPKNSSTAISQPVTFTVQANGATPLSYQWLKNGVIIEGANTTSYTIDSVGTPDAGEYTVIISNTHGSDTSNTAVLTVLPYNSRPVATITSPANNSLFSGGENFIVSGTGTDEQDGALSGASFTWRVDLHHNDHVHDGLPQTGSSTINVTIPTQGETSDNIWFRVYLIVTDNGGLTDTTFIELIPRKVTLNFATQPEGLQITLDGSTKNTPYNTLAVTGVERTIGVVSPQTANGKAWRFVRWEHGGEQTHLISTPGANTTYTAVFEEAPIIHETLLPIQDAYVASNTEWQPDNETNTYGVSDSTKLTVKNYTEGPNRESYLSFDLNTAAGEFQNLTSATLKLYGIVTDDANSGVSGSISIDIFESTSNDWSENTLSWISKPLKGITSRSNVELNKFDADYYTFDLTEFVEEKLLSEDKVLSIVLAANSDNINRALFNSSESSTDKPELILEYAEIVTGRSPQDNRATFSVYPNPASNSAIVSFNANSPSLGSIEVVDQISRPVLSRQVNIHKGSNIYSLDLAGYAPGVYYLYFKNQDEIITQKLIIK